MTVAPAARIDCTYGSPSSYGQGLRCTHPYRAHLDALIREAGHGLAVIDVKASNRPKFIRNLDALNDALVRRVMAGGAGTSTSVASRYTHPLPVRILNGRTRKQATALSINRSTAEIAPPSLLRTCRRNGRRTGVCPLSRRKEDGVGRSRTPRILSIHIGLPPRACPVRLPLRIIAAPDRNGARPAGECSNDPREPPAVAPASGQGRAGAGFPPPRE